MSNKVDTPEASLPSSYQADMVTLLGKEFQLFGERIKAHTSYELGKVSLVGHDISLEAERQEDSNPTHEHYLARVTVEGEDTYTHSLNITEPIGVHSRYTLFDLRGFTEKTEKGTGKAYHDGYVSRLPGVRVVSIATNGIGDIVDRLNFTAAATQARIRKMAGQRLALIGALCGNQPAIITATSMSTVVTNELCNFNMDNGEPVEIAGVAYYAPALVPRNRVWLDMGIKFGPSLFVDGIREVAFRETPEEREHNLEVMHESAPGLGDAPALFWQMVDLGKGVEKQRIARVLEHYPTVVISGDKDPVGEHPMWKGFARRFPNLLFLPIRGQGHAMALNAEEATDKTVRSLREAGILWPKTKVA